MKYTPLKSLVKKWPELQDAGYKRISDVQGAYNCVSTSVNWRVYPIEKNTIMWDKQTTMLIDVSTGLVVFDAMSKKAVGSNVFGKEDLALMLTFPSKGTEIYAVFLTGDQFSDYMSPQEDT
jgi:hypothetical protein